MLNKIKTHNYLAFLEKESHLEYLSYPLQIKLNAQSLSQIQHVGKRRNVGYLNTNSFLH